MLPITKYNFCQKYLINGCFGKGEFKGKIFFDRVNKNNIFNKFTITGKVIKMKAEVFEIVVDTVPTSYHFSVFYPRVFQRMFNKPMERLTLNVHHVVAGTDRVLTFTTNYEDMIVKFERTLNLMYVMITKHGIMYAEFTQEHKLVSNANKFFLTMKPTLHFHDDSYIHKILCDFSSYTCFTELVGDVHIGVVAKSKNKVDMRITVHKDTEEIYHLEATNKQAPYKFVFKSPYVVPFFKYMRGQTWFTWMMPVLKSPFDIAVEFHPVEKKLTVNTNIDTHENMIQVLPLGGDKFNVEFNHEVVAEFVAADKKVEFLRTLKAGTTLKTFVTWTGEDLLENTATATVMYKDVPQVATIGWNARDLAHVTVMVDIVGKKAPMFGDFEFHRNVKWNVISAHEFEMAWDGKTATNMMKALATPILTDANIHFNKMDVQMKIQKKFNAKTFTMMFNTKPLKFSFLPFFEI